MSKLNKVHSMLYLSNPVLIYYNIFEFDIYDL